MIRTSIPLMTLRNRRLDIFLNGSSEFTFKSPTGTTWLLDFREESKSMGNYLPFDFLMILNRSVIDLNLYPNQNMDREIFLGNNRERTILEPCNSLLIQAISGSFNANDIIVVVKKNGL